MNSQRTITKYVIRNQPKSCVIQTFPTFSWSWIMLDHWMVPKPHNKFTSCHWIKYGASSEKRRGASKPQPRRSQSGKAQKSLPRAYMSDPACLHIHIFSVNCFCQETISLFCSLYLHAYPYIGVSISWQSQMYYIRVCFSRRKTASVTSQEFNVLYTFLKKLRRFQERFSSC